jgi:predicted nucleotidyltransferase
MRNKRIERTHLSHTEKCALDELITSLREKWHDAEFTLFGSKARGTDDEESDLDILIKLPEPVKEETRRIIIHRIFDINLSFDSNISALIVSKESWQHSPLAVLPIHYAVETEGIPL